MSNENPLYVNELVITFEGDGQNNVNWSVRTDNAVSATLHMNMTELVRAGAPLSALGIRALYDIVCENMLELALEKGNLYQYRELALSLADGRADSADDIEGILGEDIADGVAIH